MKNKFRKLNDKAKFHLEQLLQEVENVAYAEGFEAGKEVAEAWSNANPVLVKSANQQRAELIAKAKEFVEDQKNTLGYFQVRNKNSVSYDCEAEFKVNAKERTIVCVLRGFSSGYVRKKTIAKCNPNDIFNEHIGQAIALARALQIDIPTEFLEAVQPSQVVVRMYINFQGYDKLFKVTTKYEGANTLSANFCERYLDSITIIDDTNAQYEVA